MADKSIKAGDIVQLKSGGPNMTVEWTNADQAKCFWFEGDNIKHFTFSIIVLKNVE